MTNNRIEMHELFDSLVDLFNPVSKNDIDHLEKTIEVDFYEKIKPQTNIYADMLDFKSINWDELRNYMK